LRLRQGDRVKRCTGRCGRELPADAEHFHRNALSADGLRARCRECTAADRRDEALVARLGRSDVATVAAAYRKGRQDGAADAVRVLKAEGRLLPSDDEAAAQARAQRIAALADEALERLGSA
jgi:hypothetical protein